MSTAVWMQVPTEGPGGWVGVSVAVREGAGISLAEKQHHCPHLTEGETEAQRIYQWRGLNYGNVFSLEVGLLFGSSVDLCNYLQ